MPVIPLGNVDWESVSENVPRLKLRNMYLTENPQSPDGLSRVSRPTLDFGFSLGTSPVKSMWRQDGCLNGDWFVVSGTTLSRVSRLTKTTSVVGDVPGVGYCRFAGSAGKVVVVRDGVAYSTDGTSLIAITFPDDVPGYTGQPPIQDVAVINSIFIFVIKGSQRFYWLFPNDVNPDPLDYASAERLPDNIEAVSIISDEIWFIGTQGPEVWSPTSNLDLPFQRINGRVYNDGAVSRDTVVTSTSNSLPCLLWVTPEGAVVLAQGSVKKISNESVEEALKTATDLRAWGFRANRHDFYCLTSSSFTYVFDITRGEWSRWDSYGYDSFIAHVGLQDGSTVYAGSSVDGTIYKFVEGSTDNGVSVVREVSGIVQNNGKPVQCASVNVKVNAGWSPSYDFEPRVELRWSDDQGATWSEYVSIGLGVQGQYYKDTVFRSLGLIDRPSRIFEFRFTDKARFRIDYASMNEV